MRSWLFALLVAVAGPLVAGTGCATAQGAKKTASVSKKKRSSTKKSPAKPVPIADDDGADEPDDGGGDDLAAIAVNEGGASYYADMLSGRATANGEKYDPNDATCAHRTLPFNTVLI